MVGLERVKQFKSNERHSQTIRVSESVTSPDIMRQSRFSQIRERRQSLNQVIREESFDLPIPHRPGWSSQRINMVDVDIRISPGWSIVPLSDLSDLKVPLKILFSKIKGSPYLSHFILEINVGKRRIRHTAGITTLNLNLQPILVDLEIHHSIAESLYVGSASFRH